MAAQADSVLSPGDPVQSSKSLAETCPQQSAANARDINGKRKDGIWFAL
jgi:hypothetical protein